MSWGDWGSSSSSKKKKSSDWSSGWGDWGSSSSSSKKSSSSDSWGRWGSSSSSTKDPSFNFGKEAKEKREQNPLVEMRALMDQYSANSADCRFEEILYSKVPSEYLHKFEKHPLTRPAVWEAGLRNNPDPKRLVPVAIRGYSQLKQRADLALAGNFSCQAALTEISKELRKIQTHTDKEIQNDLIDARQTQMELTRRLLAIVSVYLERHTRGSMAALTAPNSSDSLLDGSFDGGLGTSSSMSGSDASDAGVTGSGSNSARVSSMYGNDSKLGGLHHSGKGMYGGLYWSARLSADELRLKQHLSAVMTGANEIAMSMAGIEESLGTLQAESEDYHRRMQRSIEQFGLWNAMGSGCDKENDESVLNEWGSRKMSVFLENQQRIIANMTRCVEDDLHDLAVMQKGLRLDQ